MTKICFWCPICNKDREPEANVYSEAEAMYVSVKWDRPVVEFKCKECGAISLWDYLRFFQGGTVLLQTEE